METASLRIGDYDMKREVLLDLTKMREPFPKAEAVGEPQGAAGERRRVFPIPIPYWPDERETTYSWKLHARESNRRTGYDAALLSAEIDGKEHYFIYHLNSNDTGDVGTIGLLINGKRPEQATNAQEFADRCVERIRAMHPGEDVPIVDVGYSLGGALLELTDRKGRPAVVIDSPPVSIVLDKEGVPQERRGQDLLTVLGPHSGIYNSHGKHHGRLLVAGEKFWQTDRVSIPDFWRMNQANHELSFLGKALEKMPEWKTIPAEESQRPAHLFDAFAAYVREHTQDRPLGWSERQLVAQVERLEKPRNRAAAERFGEALFRIVAKTLGASPADGGEPEKESAHADRFGVKSRVSAYADRFRRDAAPGEVSHAARLEGGLNVAPERGL